MSEENKMNKKPQIKWTRATPLRRPDYIKSSVFAEKGQLGFLPSYDHGRPNLACLLSFEYSRMWFKERDQYLKETYSKKKDKKTDSFIKRRYVQRYMRHTDKQKILPVVTLKRFQNIPPHESTTRDGVKLKAGTEASARIKKEEEEKAKQFIRYKTECTRSKAKAATENK